MVADEDSDQLLTNTNNIIKMVTIKIVKSHYKIIHITIAIIGLSKRVNDYQLSIIDWLSVYWMSRACAINVSHSVRV